MIKALFNPIMFALWLVIGLSNLTYLAIAQTEQSQKISAREDASFPETGMYAGLRWKTQVKNIEESRESRRIWFTNNKLILQGESLVSLIRAIRYYGLIPKNYHIAEIEVLMRSANDSKNIYRLDVLLTDAFFSIAHDFKNGRLSTNTGAENDSLLISILDQATKVKNLRAYLEKQEPDYAEYKALKVGLKALLDTLQEDKRLEVMKGRTEDSLPLQKEIQDIEINMERWRWENQAFRDNYIFINIPSFILAVFANNTVVLESKVIIGTPRTPTPVLSSLLECLITYPYWHVPRSIASSELLPKLQKDPTYLTKHNYDVLDRKGNLVDARSIDWANYSRNNFPFSLRQQEGTHNALGIIKFVFDNPYSVYLHDTNAKQLFNNEMRALSHGCIRVEKAETLAHLLVTGALDTTSPLVEKYLKTKKRNTIELVEPIPIYVRYFTCEYKDGKLFQYNDIYKKNEKISDVLYK